METVIVAYTWTENALFNNMILLLLSGTRNQIIRIIIFIDLFVYNVQRKERCRQKEPQEKQPPTPKVTKNTIHSI